MGYMVKLEKGKYYYRVIPSIKTQKRVDIEIRDAFNEFPDFFVQAFKIVVDS